MEIDFCSGASREPDELLWRPSDADFILPERFPERLDGRLSARVSIQCLDGVATAATSSQTLLQFTQLSKALHVVGVTLL
jgi:hypothetical protein